MVVASQAWVKHAEALQASTEALGLYRKLADEDRHAHLPDLAAALRNQALRLKAVAQYSAALKPGKGATRF
jgi:hypothetical protein